MGFTHEVCKTAHVYPDFLDITRAPRLRKANSETWLFIPVYLGKGKAPSLKDTWNVLAVKSIKTMPCKAIGEKKKTTSDKNWRDICKEDCFVDMAYLRLFFPSSLGKREVRELELELMCTVTFCWSKCCFSTWLSHWIIFLSWVISLCIVFKAIF